MKVLGRGGLGDLRENLDRLSITDRMPVSASTAGSCLLNDIGGIE